MTAARSSHTATLLSDGRVLIAGGIGTDLDAHLSAELYDPKTGKFSATGWMADGRDDSTATLLSNGRVLIAGGEDAGITTNLLASAELYDPATGTFKPTGTMRTARELHTATLLADGRVLIAGGGNQASAAFASAELYQP
jgi:uridylate kinase